MGTNVWVKSGHIINILPVTPPVTGDTTGAWIYKDAPNSAIQATVNGTGVIGCTVTIQVSNDGINAVTTAAGVINLSGTTTASDGFTTNAAWKYVRAVVSASSGAITSITCSMSV